MSASADRVLGDPAERRLRLATSADVPALEALILRSTLVLQAAYYSSAQLDAAMGPVFGVDCQLIRDGTYFAFEQGGEIVGCGGWSKRRSLFGSDTARATGDGLLVPGADSARVRAFFVDPEHVRRGIGAAILTACEEAIRHAGFGSIELVATLAGERFYQSFGYVPRRRYAIDLSGGLKLPVIHMAKNVSAAATSLRRNADE